MSNKLRYAIHKKITNSLQNHDCIKHVKPADVKLRLESIEDPFAFTLSLWNKTFDLRTEANSIINSDIKNLVKNVEHFTRENKDWLSFKIDRNQYVKEMLETNVKRIPPPLNSEIKNIVVEFSSPNIAKPFHVGHLRSTIIGNYIANVNRYLKNKVKTINYLGDWGTQFGYIQLGRQLGNISDSAIKNDPINMFYKAYVHAHNLSKEDSTINEKANEIFKKLEEGDSDSLKEWEVLRNYTVEDLRNTYSRLGVTFDEYHWESMYHAKKIQPLLSNLEQLQLLSTDERSRKVIVINEKSMPILKSDGSTLYLTRDIAAAIDRFEQYKFDSMLYVVDIAQSEHFSKLKSILEQMKYPWANRLEHIKFGKIRGMSTRKGTAVFLTDILDETRAVMKEQQIISPNTKVPLDSIDDSTDILGVSAVIINDLKQKRMHDYTFHWDKALSIKGETGVKLQYTHCRLVSLLEMNEVEVATECDPEILQEPVINELLFVLGVFEEMLIKSHELLEPCIFVNYLFRMSHVINKCLVLIRVKDFPPEIASQRLLLYTVAKNFLSQGMRLVGLTPLRRM